MGFMELHKMADVYTRMLFSLYSHNFVSADICYDMFNEIFNQRMEEFSKEIMFDKDFITEDEFSSLAEWLLVSIAKYIARTNEILLAKICRDIQSITPIDAGILGNPRVDTLVVTVFLELMYSIKYAIFSTNEGLQELGSSDLLLFEDYLKESDGLVMQPVILTVIVVTSGYLDKAVMQLGKGTYIKGLDKDLPG